MQPSLDNAYLRVKRAKEHVRTLRRMEKRLAVDPETIAVEPHAQPLEFTPTADGRLETALTWDNLPTALNLIFGVPMVRSVVPKPAPLSDKWSVLFGETIYNLRTALDYLVYSLAYLDSGQEQERTQFPICRSPADFKHLVNSPRRNPLTGINAAHVAAIEALQPYPHAQGLDPLWLARFADFSNPDKHRYPTLVAPAGRTITTWTVRTMSAPVEVDFQATVYVSLGDAAKTPLIPTLDSLLSHVAETLDGFHPEFKREKP